MADERKYQDDEVREICDPAVGGDRIGPPAAPVEGGLSLAELQEVGLEVGMKPERIAEAALAIEMGCDAHDVGLTIHPHPTLSESLAMAAEAYSGTITDLYMPKKSAK